MSTFFNQILLARMNKNKKKEMKNKILLNKNLLFQDCKKKKKNKTIDVASYQGVNDKPNQSFIKVMC